MQRRVKVGEQRYGERWRETKGERKAFYWSVSLLVSVAVEYRQTQKKRRMES